MHYPLQHEPFETLGLPRLTSQLTTLRICLKVETLESRKICSWAETDDNKRSFLETEKVFPTGEWVLVTVTHNASGAQLYWNSELVAQGPVPMPSDRVRQFVIVGHSDWLKSGSDTGVSTIGFTDSTPL